MECVIKSQETREGCTFRILKDGKYFYANFKFNNYFYVEKIDFDSYSEELWTNFKYAVGETAPVGQFIKITLINNFMRTKLREFCEMHGKTYEADIKANKRFLLDREISLNNEHIPYLFFDIETDDRLPMKKDERGIVIADSRILSFSAIDNAGLTYQFKLVNETDEDEATLLKLIMDTFSKYGIVSGWNSENFDMPFIKQRCEKLGVNFAILDYINHLDYMEMFKKYDKKSRKSYSLQAISNEELNQSKLDQEKGNGAIYKTWAEKPDYLLAYNMEDSNLIFKLNQKLMFIEVSMHRANNAKCHVQNTMNNSDSGDYLLMREYKAANIIMPSKPTKEERLRRKAQGKIGGGYTTCLVPGFHEKVDIWDFKSLYPSIIQTWNISPETYVETIHDDDVAKTIDKEKYLVTPSDFENIYHPHRVYLRKQGIIPKVVKLLVEDRDKIKYTMDKYKESDPAKYRQMYLEQYALKTDANSIYGILSFPDCRYYSWELGDSVTTCARATIKECYKRLQFWGCTVLGGDTDSTFVVLNDNKLEDIDAKFVEFLNEWGTKWNVADNKLVFEHEKVYEPMLFVIKKGYAFKVNGKIGIKGLECIKADTNPYAAKLQKQFIEDALNKTIDIAKWETTVNELYNKVYNQELQVEDLIIVKALTKMPDNYRGYIIDKHTGKPKIKNDGTLQDKAIPAHVKLAERMLSQGKDIYPGTKIKYIVIAEKPILAISPEEYLKKTGTFNYKHKKKGYIDYEWDGNYIASYYHLRLIRPLIKVMNCFWDKLPEWNWGLTNTQMKKILKEEVEEE